MWIDCYFSNHPDVKQTILPYFLRGCFTTKWKTGRIRLSKSFWTVFHVFGGWMLREFVILINCIVPYIIMTGVSPSAIDKPECRFNYTRVIATSTGRLLQNEIPLPGIPDSSPWLLSLGRTLLLHIHNIAYERRPPMMRHDLTLLNFNPG